MGRTALLAFAEPAAAAAAFVGGRSWEIEERAVGGAAAVRLEEELAWRFSKRPVPRGGRPVRKLGWGGGAP